MDCFRTQLEKRECCLQLEKALPSWLPLLFQAELSFVELAERSLADRILIDLSHADARDFRLRRHKTALATSLMESLLFGSNWFCSKQLQFEPVGFQQG